MTSWAAYYDVQEVESHVHGALLRLPRRFSPVRDGLPVRSASRHLQASSMELICVGVKRRRGLGRPVLASAMWPLLGEQRMLLAGSPDGAHTSLTEIVSLSKQTRLHPTLPANQPPVAAPPSARVHRRGSGPYSIAARQRGTPTYSAGRSPAHSGRMTTAHSYPGHLPTAAVTIPPSECEVTSWLAGWQRLADEQGCCEASPPTPHDHQQRRSATSVLRTMSSSSLLGSGCLVRAYSTATMTSDSPSAAVSRPASSRLEVPQPILGGSCACGPLSRSAPAQPAVAQLR
jgi:hypothetical protein